MVYMSHKNYFSVNVDIDERPIGPDSKLKAVFSRIMFEDSEGIFLQVSIPSYQEIYELWDEV